MKKKTSKNTMELKRDSNTYDQGEGILTRNSRKVKPSQVSQTDKNPIKEILEKNIQKSKSGSEISVKKNKRKPSKETSSNRRAKGAKKLTDSDESDFDIEDNGESDKDEEESEVDKMNSGIEDEEDFDEVEGDSEDELDALFSDYKPKKNRKQKGSMEENIKEKKIGKRENSKKANKKLEEEKVVRRKMDVENEKKSRTASNASARYKMIEENKKELNYSSFQVQESEDLKNMTSFFLSYTKDKNAPGLSIHSILKFMKTSNIQQGKERKFTPDEELTTRMILHLKKKIGKDESKTKPDDLLVTEEELGAYVQSQRKYHLSLMKRIFKT